MVATLRMAPLGLTSLALGLVAALVCAPAASAQTMGANSAEFNAGWGRVSGQENRMVDMGLGRDAAGNRLIVDGIIQTGSDQSVFSSSSGGGAIDSFSGVGAISGGASAIGNNLVVVTQGNYNTVIVNSTQTNTGDVSAGLTLGGVGGSSGQ